MEKNRLHFIDNGKVITIYLVVLGHTPVPLLLHNFIFSFIIPVFFLISGMLFSFEKHPDYLSFLKHRSKQLLIPYLSFNIITYLFWLFIGRKYGDDATLNIPLYKPLIGIAYGNGINYYLQHCTPIWFIACLFSVENIYYLIFRKIKRKYFVLILFLIIGYADYYFQLPRLPWGINIALTAIIFYGSGNILKRFFSQQLNNSLFVLTCGAVLFLSITLYINYLNGSVDMNNRIYGNYFYFIAGGFSGTFVILCLSKILEGLFLKIALVEYIAKNTIFIIAFQGISGSFVKGITYFILKYPLSIYQDKIFINVVFSFISLLLIIPVIYFVDNYMPYLVGRTKPVKIQ